jgi:hypothetical protein
MSVQAVAAVPAAPLLLPAVSPHQTAAVVDGVAALRASVEATLSGLPQVETVVLLAGGEDATLPDGGCIDLAGSGHPHVVADVPVDRKLLAAVATRTGAPRVRADRLQGDLAVLTLLVEEVWPDVRVLPATVAAAAGGATLGGFAAGLLGGVEATGREVAVVAAGDLAATRDTTSPGYLVDGAVGFDDAVLAAVRHTDVGALAALGPGEAARVTARGWAPLLVALHIAHTAGVPVARAEVTAPRGVGQLVASSMPPA